MTQPANPLTPAQRKDIVLALVPLVFPVVLSVIHMVVRAIQKGRHA